MDGSGVARLIALAHNEIEARHDYEAGREAHAKPRAPEPDDTDIVSRYLNRLVYKPKRTYATKYAAYLQGGRDGTEPKPTGLSIKVAGKVTAKLNKLVRA